MKDPTQLRLIAETLQSAGADWEDILHRLRLEGATIIDSVKIVREIGQVDLGRAKDIVDSSVTWADRFAQNDELRRTAIEALEDDPGSN